MKISSFNVENLFRRARALNLQDPAKTKAILEQHAKLNALLEKPKYTAAVKVDIMDLIKKLGLTKDDTAEFVILRQNRGRLLTRKKNGTIEIVAEGRDSWVGWVELRNGPVDDQAILNTGQVIRDVNADIQAVVEVESRPALLEFSDQVLKTVGGAPFQHAMLIDGNDDRGIDVGVLTRGGFDIGIMRSHVDDEKNGERIFSRDCPEFKIRTPNGATLWLLVNHFKSKGFGTQASSNKRRKAQATRVAEIYGDLLNAGETNVVIVGDLNDTPDSDPLSPLLAGTNLQDIAAHPNFNDGGFPGTFIPGSAPNKIDYILLSPALFANVTNGGIFRKGAWAGKRPKKWDMYKEIEKPEHAASDHMAIWAEIAI